MNRLAGLLLLLSLAPLAALADRREPRISRTLPEPAELIRLADVKRKPDQPRKLKANDATVFILDGVTVTWDVFSAAENVTITEVHTADDGVTLLKLVGETKGK